MKSLASTLTISASVTIAGPGANLLTISGGNLVQVFNITLGTVNISGLTIANGINRTSDPLGGGIYSLATLTVSNCTFSGNVAEDGGAIYSGATTMVSNSTFSGNTALVGGGIGQLSTGALTVSDSTFTSNTCTSGPRGGGIFNSNSATLTVNNSTVSGNTAGDGGGIGNTGTLTINTPYRGQQQHRRTLRGTTALIAARRAIT